MLADPAFDLGGRVHTRSQLRATGISSRRLSSREFARVLPACYTPSAAPAGLIMICRALQTQVVPGAIISHGTAAALWGIAIPARLDGGVDHVPRGTIARPANAPIDVRRSDPLEALRGVRLHCRIPRDTHRSAVGGMPVTIHRMSATPAIEHHGVRLSHPADVLCELAAVLGHADLVAAVDSMLAPSFAMPGLSSDLLREHITSHGRFPGKRLLVRALDDARPGVSSRGETFMRLIVRAAGFPEPMPNIEVWDELAECRRYVDAGYAQVKVGLEYDGDVHRVARDAWRRDEARRDGLAAAGWVLRRMTGDDTSNPDAFLLRVRQAFLERGIPAPEPSQWRGRVLLDGAMDYARRW